MSENLSTYRNSEEKKKDTGEYWYSRGQLIELVGLEHGLERKDLDKGKGNLDGGKIERYRITYY